MPEIFSVRDERLSGHIMHQGVGGWKVMLLKRLRKIVVTEKGSLAGGLQEARRRKMRQSSFSAAPFSHGSE
jgi:hypothetical protein